MLQGRDWTVCRAVYLENIKESPFTRNLVLEKIRNEALKDVFIMIFPVDEFLMLWH